METLAEKKASPLRRWGIPFAIWTAIGVALGGQFYLFTLQSGRPGTWWGGVAIGLNAWYLWAALSPLVFWISARLPLDQPLWPRNLALHTAAGLCIALIYSLVNLWTTDALGNVLGDDGPFPPSRRSKEELNSTFGQRMFRSFTTRLFFQLNTYATLVIVWHGLNYARQLRERERQSQELARHLSDARLQTLKAQLQPHFLFNTLNAISTLVHQNPKAADEMISNLSELLRSTLTQTASQEISLREEVEVLDRYLEIEKVRFGDRLEISHQLDPSALDCLVPSLLLQPLAENAIRHGIEPRRGVGRLTVMAEKTGDLLSLSVVDNGAGLPANHSIAKEGVGLSTTRGRLRELYGARAALNLIPQPGGGLRVQVSLPWHAAPRTSQDIDRAALTGGDVAVPPTSANARV